jgi:hypothetical protein
MELLGWLRTRKSNLSSDVLTASEQISRIGPTITKARKHFSNRIWNQKSLALVRDLDRLIPKGVKISLIDDESLDYQMLKQWKITPFPEKEGIYWGPPSNDKMAISELETLRNTGTEYLVIAWSAFWWLDYYRQFSKYLDSRFPRLVTSDRLVIFDLQYRSAEV